MTWFTNKSRADGGRDSLTSARIARREAVSMYHEGNIQGNKCSLVWVLFLLLSHAVNKPDHFQKQTRNSFNISALLENFNLKKLIDIS